MIHTQRPAFRQGPIPGEQKRATPLRVAICFFGITRNFARHTLDSMERHLFSEIARVDPQFRKLAHFNKLTTVSNHRSGEGSVLINPEEFKLLNCDAVEQTDQDDVDQALDFEYIQQFGYTWRDNYASLKNLLRQFYSLNAVTNLLLAEKTRFDLVIFSRADLRFEVPVKIPRIRPRTLYTPWFHRYHGLNDRFALGDMATMIAYGRRKSMIRQYCAATGKPLSSEDYLLWYARKLELHTHHLKSINFSRIRSNGQVHAVDCGHKEKLKYDMKRGLELAGLRQF